MNKNPEWTKEIKENFNKNLKCQLDGHSDLWITHGTVTHEAYKRHECVSCQEVEKRFLEAIMQEDFWEAFGFIDKKEREKLEITLSKLI